MSYREANATERLLMAEMLKALGQGDTRAVLQTPAFGKKSLALGDLLADAAGGEQGQHLMGCLVRAVMAGLTSPDLTTRVQVMAEAANIARLYSDTHAQALADADAAAGRCDDYPSAFERAAGFAGACFPKLRRGAL
jgi:hypothetical protein